MSKGILVLCIHMFIIFGVLYKKNIPLISRSLSVFIKPFSLSFLFTANCSNKFEKEYEFKSTYLENELNGKKSIKNISKLNLKFDTFFYSL